jgi:hypothetical protein
VEARQLQVTVCAGTLPSEVSGEKVQSRVDTVAPPWTTVMFALENAMSSIRCVQCVFGQPSQ